jgi:hypothetical protein
MAPRVDRPASVVRRAARAACPRGLPARPLAGLALAGLALLLAACGTQAPPPITQSSNRAELVQAEYFPYFRVYWDGLRFQGLALTAADGTQNYNPAVGESFQYGNCNPGNGPLHTGGCVLPLQVATVVWHRHSNAGLGEQRNIILRGVPATVFAGGRSIELYTGKYAIDVFADTPARALAAAQALRPLNAPGGASGALPPPTFCPEFIGAAPNFVVARDKGGRLDCIDVLTVY